MTEGPTATLDTSAPARAEAAVGLRRRSRLTRVRRIVLASASLVLSGLFYALYVGDNAWRVRYHHGVRLPASARDIRCSGATALSYWLGDHSAATFTIDAADLPRFLAQFNVGDLVPVSKPVAGQADPGRILVGRPWTGPVPASGDRWGPSPTGTDRYGLTWRTTAAGVLIRLGTDWD